MVNVSGKIKAVPANTSREEPMNQVVAQSQEPNNNFTFVVGDYRNTGNVVQTLNINGITNEQNCTFVSAFLTKNNINQGTQVTLSPNEKAALTVVVKTAAQSVGAPEITFSYDVVAVWS